MQTDKSIGVVIPAYNPDVPTLVEFIGDLRRVVDPDLLRVEIDAPRQRDVSRLEQVADAVNVSDERRGKGAAIMAGFDTLATDVLVFADADGSVPADSVADIVQQVVDGSADVSIASRRHPSANILAHQTVVRRFLGNAFAFTARKLLPTECRDYQCGAKAVRQDAWQTVGNHCYEAGFAWDLEFISVAGSIGYDIAEVPVDWDDHPDSTVEPLSTSLELMIALVDVKRRTTAIANSPRFNNVTKTDHSQLTALCDGDD